MLLPDEPLLLPEPLVVSLPLGELDGDELDEPDVEVSEEPLPVDGDADGVLLPLLLLPLVSDDEPLPEVVPEPLP